MSLQRTAGNQATTAYLQRHEIGSQPTVDAGTADMAATEPPAGKGPAKPKSKGQPAMSLASATTALNKAYGTVHTMTPPTLILTDKKGILAAYDAECIALGCTTIDKKTKASRPWKKGDADPGIEGFQSLQFPGRIYVNKITVLPTATAHELLHWNTAAGFRAAVGEAINEGATEFLAIKAVAAAGLPTVGPSKAVAYPGQVTAVKSLMQVVGEAAVTNAYFNGAQVLIDAYEALMPGAFAALKGTGGLSTGSMMALLVPRTVPQKVALISTRINISSTPADLAAVEAIAASDPAESAAVRAGAAPHLAEVIDAILGSATVDAAALDLTRRMSASSASDVAVTRRTCAPHLEELCTRRLRGWITDAGIDLVLALFGLPYADQPGLRIALAPMMPSVHSGAQRARLCAGLGLPPPSKMAVLGGFF
ncbi:MAG: hypothetical protein ABJA34_02655 [Pseudonocardiales bacterium]